MRKIQATEAKARLADLLRTVERGETIAITRHGKTIAHLVPAHVQESDSRRKTVRTIPTTPQRVVPRHDDHR